SFALLQELLKRERVIWSGGVVDAGFALLGHTHDPGGKVAHINELCLLLRFTWGKHLAALCDTVGPVGETVGGIVWADDQARTDDENAPWHGLLCCLLTKGFKCAVGFVGDRFYALIL